MYVMLRVRSDCSLVVLGCKRQRFGTSKSCTHGGGNCVGCGQFRPCQWRILVGNSGGIFGEIATVRSDIPIVLFSFHFYFLPRDLQDIASSLQRITSRTKISKILRSYQDRALVKSLLERLESEFQAFSVSVCRCWRIN